jgi:hypothetical protein
MHFPPFHWRMETDPISKMLWYFWNAIGWTSYRKPVIIDNCNDQCQNALETDQMHSLIHRPLLLNSVHFFMDPSVLLVLVVSCGSVLYNWKVQDDFQLGLSVAEVMAQNTLWPLLSQSIVAIISMFIILRGICRTLDTQRPYWRRDCGWEGR